MTRLVRLVWTYTAACCLALPSVALANSRFPNSQQLVVDPGDPSRLVVRTNFGVLVSTDAGASWSWICETAFAGATLMQDTAIGVTRDGSILVASSEGMSRGQSGGCSWIMAGGVLAKQSLVDVTVARSDPSIAFAITRALADGGYVGLVARTDDNAQTWTAAGPTIADFFPLTIDVAPSRPDVVYASGTSSAGGEQVVVRSDDAGATWMRHAVPGMGDLYIAAVDPTSPDTIFVRTDGQTSRLLVSDDGGQSWRELFSSTNSLRGFAISPDGKQIALGSTSDGVVLLTRTADDAGSWSAEKIRPFEVECLTWTTAGLYACSYVQSDGFSVGLSADARQPFSPLVQLPRVAPLDCPDEPLPCASEWCSMTSLALKTDPGLLVEAGCVSDAGPGDAGQATVDAANASEGGPPSDAADGPAGVSSGGCGCRLSVGHRLGSFEGVLLCVGVMVRRRRTRGDRHAARSLRAVVGAASQERLGYTRQVTFRLLFVLAAGAAACSSSHESSSQAGISMSDATVVCAPPTSEVCPATVPSFSGEIAPILNQRCNNCHAPDIDGGPWPLDTQQNVKDWSTLLIKDLKECSMPPPGSGAAFPTEERDKLWAWLICGAPNN